LQRSVGNDGVLYTLVDRDDAFKFKILSDDELREENRRSQEMAATLQLSQTRPRSASSARGMTVTVPKLGTPSRNKKLEQRVWDKEVRGGSATRTGTDLIDLIRIVWAFIIFKQAVT
jgi:hypothetical protein